MLRSFIGSLTLTVKDVTIGLDIEPEPGAADSGDLEIDLPNLFVAIGEAAEERKGAVALLIDEIQYLIKKGMVYSAAHGDMAFTVPLFDEFMIRAIPELRR